MRGRARDGLVGGGVGGGHGVAVPGQAGRADLAHGVEDEKVAVGEEPQLDAAAR